ncbi:uncharacterized protein YALI1_F16844g [Yarrowia lipolytica]|uniref:Uncharacterized protein n=1 Tax=Yarrowia lipolytica TaxID=4952 RepID=A0A1D8NN68_YARLL|nr:hypothetical protein YALI1_F16844g [Yarrowia lipolytica]
MASMKRETHQKKPRRIKLHPVDPLARGCSVCENQVPIALFRYTNCQLNKQLAEQQPAVHCPRDSCWQLWLAQYLISDTLFRLTLVLFESG